MSSPQQVKSAQETSTSTSSNDTTTSFVLPVKLGQAVNRQLPNELEAYIDDPNDWESFCDAFDQLTLNIIDTNGPFLMRLALTIGISCLVLVILFGYLDSDDDDNENNESSTNNNNQGNGEGNDNEKNDGNVSTALVLVTAIPICFPFVTAAVLNCHGASTISTLKNLCTTTFHTWAVNKGAQARVEQLQSVSNQDEVIDKFMICLQPSSWSPSSSSQDVETGTPRQEASPEAAPKEQT